jgi:hypothetical protein
MKRSLVPCLIALAFAALPATQAHASTSVTLSAKAYAFWLKQYKSDATQAAKISKALVEAESKLNTMRPFLLNPSITSEYKLEVLGAELAKAESFLSTEGRVLDSITRSFFESKANSLKKAVESGENSVIVAELASLSRFVSITKANF